MVRHWQRFSSLNEISASVTVNSSAPPTTSSIAVTVPRINSTISSLDSDTFTTQTNKNTDQITALTSGFL